MERTTRRRTSSRTLPPPTGIPKGFSFRKRVEECPFGFLSFTAYASFVRWASKNSKTFFPKLKRVSGCRCRLSPRLPPKFWSPPYAVIYCTVLVASGSISYVWIKFFVMVAPTAVKFHESAGLSPARSRLCTYVQRCMSLSMFTPRHGQKW